MYTIEGTLIGDGASFVEHVRERFGKVLGMTKETQKKRTHENMTMINEEMRKKQEGHTLGEKIAKNLEKIKSKNVVSHIDDAFFLQEIEQDCRFYIRRTNMFRAGGRTRNIEDEVAIAQKLQAELEAIEAKRDQTYEEFKFKYEEHIDGKAPNLRTARASNFGDDVKSARSRSNKGKGKRLTSSRGAEEEEDDAKSAKSRKSGKADQDTADQINQELENLKFEIPGTCMINFPKNAKIEKLEAKYMLVAHPHPSLEGEMLLIQPKKDDQADKDHFVTYRDYSLRKRMPNREKPTISAAEKLKDKKKKESEISKLQCLEVAIDEPLQNVEWINIAEVMNQSGGLAWFQVLPVNQKSSMPLQFNAVHLLPEEKFPFPLPIETFLKNNESNERKIERRNLKDEQVSFDEQKEIFAANAKAQGLVVIPEYDFKHVFYKMTEMNLSSEGLVYSYTKCAVFLGLKDEDTAGITVLLSKKWMMVSQIDKPYMHSSEGHPVYLDGLAFAGLVQLQEVEKVWPSTVGAKVEQKKVFESMKA